MRAPVGTLLLASLLAAVVANGSEIEPEVFEKGHFVELTVLTLTREVSKCYLVSPSNKEIDLLESEALPDKYEHLTNYISPCRARINDLDENDEGLWTLNAVVPTGDDTVNELKDQVHVLIRGSDTSVEDGKAKEVDDSEESSEQSVEDTPSVISSEEENTHQEDTSSKESSAATEDPSEALSSEEKNEDETQWLSDLRFITRIGLNVDINMPKTSNSEICTLTKPDGTTVDMKDGIAGVTAHSSSDFVSCRVVVGPMDDSLLGNWTLCGSYKEDNVERRRCQNAEIVWRSTSNPDSVWQTTIHARFNHVVHFGGTLSPTARGSGSVVSCHLVTPDDEDLVVTRDREYPNVELVQNSDSACSIAIGPIAESHLGDWAVYGTFSSTLYGYNEVRQLINMELYDKNNPYDQAYNVTILNPSQHVVNLGSTIPVEVTGAGVVDSCQFTMPSGQTYLSTGSMPTGVSFVSDNRVACRLSVGPITADMLGDWLLIGKFSNRGVHTENRLTFTIIQEDPSNPIQEDRIIQNLDGRLINTSIGASHQIAIVSEIWSTFQSCHIRTPEGLQYTIMEGFNIPGVEVITASNVDCGVTVEVSEGLIGTWTLISREIRSSQLIERRLQFIIYVEESVEATPNEITIAEGNSIHVRLAHSTELHDTCKLKDPNDEEAVSAKLDENHEETCGFVVPSVDAGHSGTWNIVYGTKIIYKASVLVNVNAREDPDTLHLNWVEHYYVNQTIGPEEAVYCRVLSPGGDVVFDGFGRCQVALNRVMQDQHEGQWSMVVGLPGKIVTQKAFFTVKVIAADIKPQVTVNVVNNKPTVELSCSVTSSQQMTGCLFRMPFTDEVLVANQGVSEARYVFHVNQTRIDSDYFYSCNLKITEVVSTDLGVWRCDLESEEENYYGFPAALPWAMQDPVVTESVEAGQMLTPQAVSVSVEEQEPVMLACSARAPLRYCYFRAPNGTIFNVGPGMSSPTVEYVGAGLDAGECGARFRTLLRHDAGTWSCHAGIGSGEQYRSILVSVEEEMSVRSDIKDGRLVIKVQVARDRPLEYCRFVRFDGFGFSSENVPYPYHLDGSASSGCRLNVAVTPEVMQPWTVVAKLMGRDGEISRVTGLNWRPPGPPVYYNALFMWLPLLLIVVGCSLVAAALAPAKNRRWAADRASSMRASMRASMRRFPSFHKKQIASADTNPAA